MKLIKDGKIIELSNQGHIDALKEAGFTEYVEPVTKASKKGVKANARKTPRRTE